ncbi:DNA polymerase III subunit chi [Blastomonas sp.]|uniref:DNA polymerase III subunit chi n=1 Tax=Blastomonas sp. TaxID=1909299 RepID=UPI003593BAD6
MRFDFYHLTRSTADRLVAVLADKTLAAGHRLLVVSEDDAQLGAISTRLWTFSPTSFLAHDRIDGANPGLQPILLADRIEPANGARFVVLADGTWRDAALTFERTMLLFDAPRVDAARDAWRALKAAGSAELHYWKQDGGKWVEAG